MNKPNNKRRKESQTKIENVFLELIQNKDLDKISVTDICKIANLNRSTFYANYIDIYDLADKIREKLENEVFGLYSLDNIDLSDNNFLKLFYHIKENQMFYKTYFKLGFDKSFIVQKYNYYHAQKYYNQEYIDYYIDYHIEFFKAGFNAIILKWLNSNCKETPEEILNIIKAEYSFKVS